MPALRNSRREAYAQARARGFTQRAAGIAAGYTGADGNMSKLEQKPDIYARILELRGTAIEENKHSAALLSVMAASNYTDKEKNLAWCLNEWIRLKTAAEQARDLDLAFKCMSWITAGLGVAHQNIPNTPPLPGSAGPLGGPPRRRKQRDKEAQEDHADDKPDAVGSPTEGEISELDQLVDQLGDGAGDEPEAADPALGGLAQDVQDADGRLAGGEDGDGGPQRSDQGPQLQT